MGSCSRSLTPSGGGSTSAPSSTADSAKVCFPSAQLYLSDASCHQTMLCTLSTQLLAIDKLEHSAAKKIISEMQCNPCPILHNIRYMHLMVGQFNVTLAPTCTIFATCI